MITPLTEREKELISHLFVNPDTDYLAKKMSIAKTTVKTHICNICDKLHISGESSKAKIIIKVINNKNLFKEYKERVENL